MTHIHQLISVTHNIFSAFDVNPSPKVCGVFLHLSKAFDRVCHDGLLCKLRSNGIDGNLFKLIKSFLNNRCQRVVLNGQSSVWKSVTAGVLQGSVLGPLFFLIYINDLPLGLTTNIKLFADDTSLFSVVNNASVSASRLNNDLVKIRDWAFNWKMSFNPDPTKQGKEVIFSKKKKILGTHPSLFFNNSLIEQDTTQKHLGLTLDHKLTFQYHVNEKIKKAMKGIGLLRKLQSILPRTSLLTIYKSFIRPHLDYGDVVYDQPSNDAFSNKLGTFQYNATLTITGAMKGTSREKSYQELRLEYLQQ